MKNLSYREFKFGEYFEVKIVWECNTRYVTQGLLRDYGYIRTWFCKVKINIQHTSYLFFYMNVVNIVTKH